MKVDKAKLILGIPIEVGDYYIVHPLTIGEIVESGYEQLQIHLNIMLLDWDSFKVDMPEEEKTDKNLFKMIRDFYYDSDDFFDEFNKSFKVFLKRPLSKSKKQALQDDVFKKISDFFLKGDFKEVREILRKQYLIQKKEKEEPRKFADDRAKKLYEQIQKNQKEVEKYKKKDANLIDLISSLRWKVGLSKKDIMNITLYELYDGLKRVHVIDNVSNLFTGIYSGSINAKSIDDKELDWMRHVEI